MTTMPNYFICLDTETANDIECPFVYDIGGAVITEDGAVVTSFSFAVEEIFNDTDLMTSAYCANKLPKYYEDIADGKREIRTLYEIRSYIARLVKRYRIKYAVAHNARFDNCSLNTTLRYRSTSVMRFFLPYGVKWVDTLKMARLVFKEDENYRAFCVANEYVTKRGQNRYTAEILFRYLSADNSFIEEHQGLADALIEKDILVHCLRTLSIEDGLLWSK